jgi:glycosyltransferase involved in cell wall biosynthesis
MQSTYQRWRARASADNEWGAPTVLHCIPTLSGGGAERQLRQLVAPLIQRGIGVAIFSRFAPGDEEAIATAGALCLPIRTRGNHDPRLALELLRAVRTVRPRIVQSWLPQMDVLCGLFGRSAGAKWIVSERASPKAYPPTAKHLARRFLGARADLVIANSPSGLSVWGDQPKKVVSNGIDFDGIDRMSAGGNAGTQALAGRTVIISIARLTGQKRADVLIDAMKMVAEKIPNALLILLGIGPDRQRLMARVSDQGLEAHVSFAGFQTDVSVWLKSADIFVSASDFEGHPNSVIEAAAAGVPMVLTDIREHRDSVGEGACYAPVGDAAGFASAILRLIGSDDLRRSLAASARQKVSAFSVAAAADAYAQLYRELLQDGA